MRMHDAGIDWYTQGKCHLKSGEIGHYFAAGASRLYHG